MRDSFSGANNDVLGLNQKMSSVYVGSQSKNRGALVSDDATDFQTDGDYF